jgi:hypothetical protein
MSLTANVNLEGGVEQRHFEMSMMTRIICPPIAIEKNVLL